MAPAVFSQLGVAPLTMSLLYGATSLHALGKLRSLHGRSRSLDTKKLFAMSVLLLCLTRTMGFATIGALNMQSVGFESGSSRRSWRDDPDERFYEKAMMVLFDLPDFMIVSAYTLLAVVWAEAFLQSRRHWLSARVYKRQLLLGYMVFNSALYGGQLVLYTLLFLPSFNQSGVLAVIYLFLTSVNLLLPLLLAVLFSYLTCTFSGFPYKSEGARLRMRRVGRVVMLWTIARVVWGLSALTAVVEFQRLVGNATSFREQVYSILVVALFLVTELYPLLAALDDELLLAMSGSEDVGRSVTSGSSGSAGGGRQGERTGLAGDSSSRGDHGRRNRISDHPTSGKNPFSINSGGASGEDNPTQPLLPRGGRKGDSWVSLSSASDLDVGSYVVPEVVEQGRGAAKRAEGVGREGRVVRRHNAFQQEKWALRSCHQCHMNFLPAPPNHDVEFCSGDCRFSCSIMRHTKAKKMKKQAQAGRK
eukprot:g11553.t1